MVVLEYPVIPTNSVPQDKLHRVLPLLPTHPVAEAHREAPLKEFDEFGLHRLQMLQQIDFSRPECPEVAVALVATVFGCLELPEDGQKVQGLWHAGLRQHFDYGAEPSRIVRVDSGVVDHRSMILANGDAIAKIGVAELSGVFDEQTIDDDQFLPLLRQLRGVGTKVLDPKIGLNWTVADSQQFFCFFGNHLIHSIQPQPVGPAEFQQFFERVFFQADPNQIGVTFKKLPGADCGLLDALLTPKVLLVQDEVDRDGKSGLLGLHVLLPMQTLKLAVGYVAVALFLLEEVVEGDKVEAGEHWSRR